MGNLLRSEGHARQASIGMMFGGILSFRSRSDFRFSSGCSRSSNCDVIIKLAAGYGDIPVAAYGIVKRIDQFPLNISMGLCQGFMPLVGYNFASGNYKRMREVSFLRIACIAVPFTSANFLISYTLQAMGKGMQSAILTFSRQGLLNIPLLIFMDFTVGLYGMIWTQLIVELVMLPISLGMYKYTFRHLKRQ